MNKMTVVNTYQSIITVNVNGINSPIQTHRMAEWMKKQDPTICYYQRLISALKTHIRGVTSKFTNFF